MQTIEIDCFMNCQHGINGLTSENDCEQAVESTANITKVGLNYKVVGPELGNRSRLPTMKCMTAMLVLTVGVLCHSIVSIKLSR